MKKALLILSAALTLNLSAQNNGELEQWSSQGTYEDPDGWITFNIFSAFGDSVSCLKTTTAYSGNYAALLRTTYSNFLSDTLPGFMLQSIPFTTKPNSFRFAYQHSCPQVDSGMIQVEFYKGPTDNSSNVIGYAYFMAGTNTNWERVEIPITWVDLNTPDTMVIVATSAFSGGSLLKIDDISVSAYGVGIARMDRSPAAAWFMSSGDFFAPGITGDATLELFDNNGRMVFQGRLNHGKNGEAAELPRGIYMYRIHTSNSGSLTTGKILKY